NAMISFGNEAACHFALRLGMLARGKMLRQLGSAEPAQLVLNEVIDLAKVGADFTTLLAAQGDLGRCLLDQCRLDEAQIALEEPMPKNGGRVASGRRSVSAHTTNSASYRSKWGRTWKERLFERLARIWSLH